MKEFYKTDFVSVFYDTETDALWVKYFQNVPSDKHFVPIIDATLNGFTSLKTQKFAVDVRRMGVLGIDSQALIISKLLPGMIRHLKGKKLYHVQLLNPNEIMAKVSANNVKRKSMSEGMETVQFSDENEVIKYLNKCTL
ncbi:MAG TPA: hypothetical protein VL443_13935 [Cyclobacteriaceae bacterium]|jgi:hypothetical protein|nr:hypothetical protein [Cyclobacteriaceae bacterium]